jgi:hypothetical protein
MTWRLVNVILSPSLEIRIHEYDAEIQGRVQGAWPPDHPACRNQQAALEA